MKMRYTIRRAGRSLRHAKVRTLLTSLAIAVGAFTLTLSLAAGEGSREYADKLIGSNINPRALLIVKDKAFFSGGQKSSGLDEYSTNTTTAGRGGAKIQQLTQADVDKLAGRSDLTQVRPVYQLSAKYLTVEGNSKKFTAEVNAYDSTIRNETAAGSIPSLGTQIGDNDMIMPEQFAATLGQSAANLIGKKVTLTIAKPNSAPTQDQINQIVSTQGVAGLNALTQGQTKDVSFTIRGLAKKSSTALTAGTALQISPSQARSIAEYTTKGTDNYQKYTAVTALASGSNKAEDVKAALEKAGYAAETAKDLQNLLFTIVNTLQGIVIGFGVLALVASVFGIINTQYISVLERTQQIGLMKALGMRRRDVARLFRYEAAWIGLLGGVIGSGAAWALGTSINPWLTNLLSLGDGNSILVFQPIPMILLIIALMIIAIVAGYLPARKAARLDPIEALRTE